MPVSATIRKLATEDLALALARVDRANDMLPPREDDKVAGRIAGRFVEGLHARITAGAYRCNPAAIVPVPKRAFTTRPAAVMALQDRVVYEALVDRTRVKINKLLSSAEIVFWPRADASKPRWQEFERAPLSMGGGWVANADVAGFYESVDHDRLMVALADAGVAAADREAIGYHLGDLMCVARGLPQGVESSDALATLYLAPVDRALQLRGLTFWRHGDDYRLWAPTYPDALAAMFELEQALRGAGLMLNSGKLCVAPLGTYGKRLTDVDQASDRFRTRLREAREAALRDATETELAAAIDAAGIDEDMQWRFWYHHTVDAEEMLAALAPSLTPKPIEIVVEMFTDLMSKDPKDPPAPGLAHARLTFCIRRLARAKSPAALPWVGNLLVTHADEVQDLANYMLAVIDVAPDQVVAACQFALTNKSHLLDWERAWIYRVLSRVSSRVHTSILDTAQRVADSDGSNWLARVEATRLLARAGRLAKATATQITTRAPAVYRGDLSGTIAMIEKPGDWTAVYLDGARQDALAAVVIDGVRAKAKQVASRSVAT